MTVPSPVHHLLIPFAGRRTPACAAALTDLRLPNLGALCTRLTLTADDTQDDSTLSPPHERALAAALVLPTADGAIPWAALQTRRVGLARSDDTGDWALITLCHWEVEVDDVVLGDPETLTIDAAESDALLRAAQPFFEEDGIALHAGAAPGRWLACGPVFAGLPTASIDRVINGPISQWAPKGDGARTLRRLQNEMQMLLYTQRVNDERTARGVPPINSFWLSGTGAWPTGVLAGALAGNGELPTVDETLRRAALHDDGAAWAAGWRALDAGPLAELLAAHTRGESVALTLCGDGASRRYTSEKRGFGRWVKGLFGHQPASTLIKAL